MKTGKLLRPSIGLFMVLLCASLLYGILAHSFPSPASQSFHAETDQLGMPTMLYPQDNAPTKQKIALGRKLFMDRRLSPNNTMSCAMCHVPEQAFTVNETATAVGIQGRSNRRNAPSLFNVGYLTSLFHDGREDTLEKQVIRPLTAINEMGNPSAGSVIDRISTLPDYQGRFEAVFGNPVDIEALNKAIAAYERSLVAGNSRFDQWYYAKNDQALNQVEINGFKLFTGKARCAACHRVNEKDALFTDQSFHNTGIGWARQHKPLVGRTFPITLAPGVVVQMPQHHFDKVSEVAADDSGRFEVTQQRKDSWAYKTPSLRNIALTGPYMHDGSLSTLDNVVDFYNKGGEDNPYKAPLLKPLGLSSAEKKALLAFLKTLTGANVKRLETDARSAYTIAPMP